MNEANHLGTMAGGSKCGQCGMPLETGALAGLCPACLLKQGAAADTATAGQLPPFQPPLVSELAPLFPQLEILELIGKGGMGAVYKARQPSLDRFVALKLLPARPDTGTTFTDRFNREARALARLNHPNIVGVYEFGTAGGYHFFLMEFVDGVNLRQLEKNRQLSPREALQIVAQICDALQYAHDEGIVHRDIKPENVLLDRRGRLKIADFGLAKLLDAPSADARLTAEGQVMGTPHYMAPEQVEHPRDVDHRADIYSLGVVFYELLTGELPLGKFPPPSRKVQMDVRLDDVVLRTLEKQPELRYQQAGEVKTAMETIAGTPASARAVPPVMAQTAPPSWWRYLKNRVWPPLVVRRNGQRAINRPALAMRLMRGVVASLFGSLSLAVTIANLRPYGIQAGFFPAWGICFAALLVLVGLVMAVRLLRGFAMPLDLIPELDPPTGTGTGTVILPRAAAPATGGEAQSLRNSGRLALGLFLTGTLGTLLLMTLSSRHELALIFGGLALVLALVFGLMSWRDRLGKGVAIAILSLFGLGIAMVIASGIIYFLRSSSFRDNEQAALEAERRAVEKVRQAALHLERERVTGQPPDFIQAEAAMAALEVFGDKLEEALEQRDQTNSAKYAEQFVEQLQLLNRLVKQTEVEFPSNRLALTLKAHEAIKRGELPLAETLFKAAMATTAGEDDYPERIAALAEQQRRARGQPGILGPVIERELRTFWSGTNCLMDLDSGRDLTPPKVLLDTIPLEVAQKRALLALLPRNREGKLWQWLEEGGADLVCGDGADNLLWLNGYVLGQTLDQSNSVKVLAALQEFRTHAKDYAAAATTNAQYYNNAWLPIPWHRMAGSNYCVLFKTRENRFGLLQVVGQLTNPPGVKIRYRLVRDAAIPEPGSDQPTVLSVTFADTVNNARDEVLLVTEPKPRLTYQWYRSNNVDDPVRLIAPSESAKLKLRLAEAELAEIEQGYQAGLIPMHDRDKALFARDIAAAELKQDPVEVARLKLQLSELALQDAERKWKAGLASQADCEQAKTVRDTLAAAYDRLRPKKKF